MTRDIRTVNHSTGQLIESDKVLKRIGEINYRNLGVREKISKFNQGKALILEGLRVSAVSGMTVSVSAGSLLQKLTSGDILPVISIADQSVTVTASSGVARTDIIECQVTKASDKNDTSEAVLNTETGIVTPAVIKRDIKYSLSVQTKAGSSTATSATAGVASGTVSINTSIDLSSKYLLNLADGEDGSFQEIDLRGADPINTTSAEIISKINSAVGRTMASLGTGNVIILTGSGLGETSYFEIKPPFTDSGSDALFQVFGIANTGVYNYVYKGTNEWIKLAEIDVGASTTTITTGLIRNIDQKDTWASDGTSISVGRGINEWCSSSAYHAKDTIKYNGGVYECVTSHNSGTAFESDFLLGYWLMINIGKLPNVSDSSIDSTLTAFNKLQVLLNRSITAGGFSSQVIVSTYGLSYTVSSAYNGGVLSPNGDIQIHFVPNSATVGQKLTNNGSALSTYSLAYTTTNAYQGGVLDSNGNIHFVPGSATVGQKISPIGSPSTYTIPYTTAGAFNGGVLAPDGSIYFIPSSATMGQKVSSAGVVSTYTLQYTTATAYRGGVLAPNGDIHFIPRNAIMGQKISSAGVVSTYTLQYTTTNAYFGGVLAPNGDIHFVPNGASVGQKISSAGVVSTYTLQYTGTNAYSGGVLAPNGDIHFIPTSATMGQKISANGVVSTYSLAYTTTNAYSGAVLLPNGDIHFIPSSATVGQKIMSLPAIPWSLAVCSHSFFNKL